MTSAPSLGQALHGDADLRGMLSTLHVAGESRLGLQGVDHQVRTITDADDREVRLWEIAENLDRAELTALERSEHIAEWVRLTEKKLAQVEPVSDKGGRGKEGGVRAAVRNLGVDRNEAQRAAKVYSIAPEAKQAARELGPEPEVPPHDDLMAGLRSAVMDGHNSIVLLNALDVGQRALVTEEGKAELIRMGKGVEARSARDATR